MTTETETLDGKSLIEALNLDANNRNRERERKYLIDSSVKLNRAIWKLIIIIKNRAASERVRTHATCRTYLFFIRCAQNKSAFFFFFFVVC